VADSVGQEVHGDGEHSGPPVAAAPAPAAAQAPGQPRRWRERVRAELTPRALWSRHRVFSILVLLSVALRVLAELAFRPAMLISDSFNYLQDGTTFTLGQLRPSGYPILLHLISPLHSLLVATVLQHLVGIGTAVLVYALLRSWGLPGWGAALATVPTLFDPRQVALESYILPDTVFGFVVVGAVAVLLTRRRPGMWQCVVAGLAIAYAALLRGDGILLIIPMLAYMLVRKVGWRVVTAAVAAFAVPILGYATLFYADYGQFNVTNSDGMFLWARTMTFANCAIIKPARDLDKLCPSRQGIPAYTRYGRSTPADYLWAPRAWWKVDARPGPTAANNALAMRFAIDAITAQPTGYVDAVAADVAAAFKPHRGPGGVDELAFTRLPAIMRLQSYYARDLRLYTLSDENQHAVQPYAHLLFVYQRYVYLPGPALLAVLLVGLVGIGRNWRRWGGPGALPWAAAVVTIVASAALSEYLYRYVIVAVPLACIAAGLAFVPARRQPDPARLHDDSPQSVATGPGVSPGASVQAFR
jgi:Dolichyl-phosphate-mannose-protein mannosyltransferase